MTGDEAAPASKAWQEGDFRELISFETVPDCPDTFVGLRIQPNLGGALFGGMVLAQAVHCAQATAGQMRVHVVQAEFLRSGGIEHPVVFEVERTRDGRRFANRRVEAKQNGRSIFHAQISFAAQASGFTWSPRMPVVPAPDSLQSAAALLERYDTVLDQRGRLRLTGFPAIEARYADPEAVLLGGAATPHSDIWARMPGTAALATADHQSAVAYLSDWWIASISRAAVPAEMLGPRSNMISLNHTLWFHHPVRVDDWILFATEALWVGENRVLCRGQLFSREGVLAASVIQEAMIESG